MGRLRSSSPGVAVGGGALAIELWVSIVGGSATVETKVSRGSEMDLLVDLVVNGCGARGFVMTTEGQQAPGWLT